MRLCFFLPVGRGGEAGDQIMRRSWYVARGSYPERFSRQKRRPRVHPRNSSDSFISAGLTIRSRPPRNRAPRRRRRPRSPRSRNPRPKSPRPSRRRRPRSPRRARRPSPRRSAAARARRSRPSRRRGRRPRAPRGNQPVNRVSRRWRRPERRGPRSSIPTQATRAELKTTLETLGVDFKSSDSTKYLQRKLEIWLEEN